MRDSRNITTNNVNSDTLTRQEKSLNLLSFPETPESRYVITPSYTGNP